MGRRAHGKAGMNDIEVLIDSAAFVGLMLEQDAHHERVVRIFDNLKAHNISLATTSFVVAETATVLSHASGQTLARTFLDEVIAQSGLPVIFIDESLYNDAVALFHDVGKRGSSMTDCANVAVVKRFEIPKIFSFDKAYRTQFNIPMTQDTG